MELTLFSSDSSGQYKKDIYNVIAAPYNSEYRFRYTTQYIEPSLFTQLKENTLANSKALIVFRRNSDKQGVNPFMVPIRWVTIKKSYLINEICIIDFVIKDYPEYNQAFKEASTSEEKNQKFSKAFFDEEGRCNKYVLGYIPNIVSRTKCDYERQEALWISIIQALKNYSAFSNTSFYRTLLPTKRKNKFAKSLIIKESQYKEIEIWHYCSEESKSKISELEIQCDTNYINPVFGNKDRIECRYDRINYGFQAIKGKNNLKSQIVFRIKNIDENLTPDYSSETKISIPVILKRKWSKRIIRSILSVVGSAAVLAFSALISIETIDFPNWAFVVVLLIGTIAPAISWFISSEE